MLVFLGVYTYVYLLSFFKQNKRIYTLSVGSILILFFGFRYQVGADWPDYYKAFQRVEYLGIGENLEIGYRLLNYSYYIIFGEFQTLILSIFCFSLFLTLNSFKKYTDNYKVAMYAWMAITFLNFGILRQVISAGIFWYSIRYIIKQNFKKYFFSLLVATLFHSSAIILILLYFIKPKTYRLKKVLKIIAFGIIFWKSNILFKIIPLLRPLPYIGKRLNFYIGTRFASGSLDIRVIENILLLIIIYYFEKQIRKKYPKYYLFLNMHIMNIFCQIYFANFFLFSSRYIKYFEIGTIILYSHLYGVVSNKRAGKYFYLLITGGYFFFRYSYILLSKPYYLPYQNYLMRILQH